MGNLQRISVLANTSLSGAGAIQAIMKLAPSIIRDTPLPKLIKVIISDARSFPGIVTTYRTLVIEPALTLVEGILKRANENQEWRVDDPFHTARLIIAPIIFSVIWRVVFDDTTISASTGSAVSLRPKAESPDKDSYLEANSGSAQFDLDTLFSTHTEHFLSALSAPATAQAQAQAQAQQR